MSGNRLDAKAGVEGRKEKWLNRRQFVRYDLTEMRGTLLVGPNRKPVVVTPVDVSADGMALITDEPIGGDDEVILSIGEKNIRLSVVWCVPVDDAPPHFRFGLKRLNTRHNLAELLLGREIKD